MQHNYEYLKDSSEALFNLTLVADRKFEFSLEYFALYEDLRTIEDNYRLLKRLDILLRDPVYCLRFFRPLPKGRLCYNTISLKGVSNGETKKLHP